MAVPVNTRHDNPVNFAPGAPSLKDRDAVRTPPSCSRVLIVEDDPTAIKLYEKKLKSRGYEITSCTNAEDAWKIYSNTCYPIVLLDWMLLGMDGLTLCRKMRAHPHGSQSVIVVITSNDQPEHLDEVLEAGADDYIAKPVDIDLFDIRLTIAEKRATLIRERAEVEEKLTLTGLELQHQRDWLEVTVSSIGDAVISTDAEGFITFINAEGERLTGWTEEEALGSPVEEVFKVVHEQTGDALDNPVRTTLLVGASLPKPWRTVLLNRDGSKAPVDDNATQIRDQQGRCLGAVLIFRDITDRVLQEKALEASMHGVEQVKREWESTVDSLSEVVCLLDESGRVMRANMGIEHWRLGRVVDVHNKDLHTLFHPECGDPSCYLLQLWPKIQEGLRQGDPQELEVRDDVLGSYIRLRFRPVVPGPGHRESTENQRDSFAVAIIEDISERKLLERRLEMAREQELQTGSRIQQTLLFDGLPEGVEGLALSAKTVPSRHIDGDFYAFFTHSPKCLDIAVGDVMGKGVPAALVGAAAKNQFLAAISHLIQASADHSLPEPKEIVRYVHGAMATRLIELENFLTLCYARLDLEARTMTFVDCGHTRTLHYRAKSGDCVPLQGDNMPLGFSDVEVIRQSSVPFGAGDVMLFYSDGVVEAKNESACSSRRANLELYGEERLMQFLLANRDLAPADLIDRIRAEVVRFSGSEQFADDLTVIAVRIQDWEA